RAGRPGQVAAATARALRRTFPRSGRAGRQRLSGRRRICPGARGRERQRHSRRAGQAVRGTMSDFMRKATYPIHLNLSGRGVLVVGAGRVATRKIERLVEAGANLLVVAAEASAPVRKLAAQAALKLVLRSVQESDLT